MQKYYVTLATFKHYIGSNITIEIINEPIKNEAEVTFNDFLKEYKISQEIHQILSSHEISLLKKFLYAVIFCKKKNLDEFSAIDFQQKDRPYVFKTPPPAYHKNIDCPFLSNNFENLEIPVEIINSDEITQQRFRDFADQNKKLFYENPEKFKMLATTRFSLKNAFNDVKYPNSNTSSINDSLINLITEAIEKTLQNENIYKVKFAPYFKGKQNRDPDVAEWFKIYKIPIYKKLEKELTTFSSYNFDLNESFLKELGLRPCYSCFN